MNKLERNLEIFLNPMKISKEGVEYWDFTNVNGIKPLAEETKKIAIEFAKKLMETKIYAYKEGKIGQTINGKIPPEYYLMKGELILNGDKLFDKFIEEYYV